MGDPAPTAEVLDMRQAKAGHSIVRTQNYSIERIAGPSARDFAGRDEFIVLLYENAATLTSDGRNTALPARSVVIIPPGSHRITVEAGLAILLATDRSDIDVGTIALNAEAYSKPDARVAPVGTPDPIVQRLYTEIDAIIKEPDVAAEISKRGFEPSDGGPPEQLSPAETPFLPVWAHPPTV